MKVSHMKTLHPMKMLRGQILPCMKMLHLRASAAMKTPHFHL